MFTIKKNVYQVRDHDTAGTVVSNAEIAVVEFSLEEWVVIVAFCGKYKYYICIKKYPQLLDLYVT